MKLVIKRFNINYFFIKSKLINPPSNNTVVPNELAFMIHFLSNFVVTLASRSILSGAKPTLESTILSERNLFRHLTETIAAVLSTNLASTVKYRSPRGCFTFHA